MHLFEVGIVPTPDQAVVVRDVWNGEIVGVLSFGDSIDTSPLPSHASALYHLTIVHNDALAYRPSSQEIFPGVMG